jgi:hypothetical protein
MRSIYIIIVGCLLGCNAIVDVDHLTFSEDAGMETGTDTDTVTDKDADPDKDADTDANPDPDTGLDLGCGNSMATSNDTVIAVIARFL